jgi:hypothetical protein
VSMETAFDRALSAAQAVPAEDRPLFLRTLLAEFPIREWPGLLVDRDLEDVHRMILWLWLDLDVDDRAAMLFSLLERAVDGHLPPAKVLQMAEWIEACLEGRP